MVPSETLTDDFSHNVTSSAGHTDKSLELRIENCHRSELSSVEVKDDDIESR